MSAADQLTEVATRHQVFLERLKTGEVNDLEDYLKKIDKDIRARLGGLNLTEFQRGRLEALLREVNQSLNLIFIEFRADLIDRLEALAEYEAGFEARALASVAASPDFEAVLPAARQVWATVNSTPLSLRDNNGGKLLEPFIKDWTDKEREAVVGAIRRGYFEGQTSGQIVTAIRGTRKARYKDGIIAASRRHMSAIVRTSVQHISSAARMQVWEDNPDVVTGYQWRSTLDSKTTVQCRSLDGQIFKDKKGPKPPIHINCRSTIKPVLDPEFDIFDEGATRASVDGYVDAKLNYYDWLKKQTPEFQDAAIGAVRAKLLRDGGLSAERFRRLQLDKQFNPLTLEEMRQLEPLAFKRAGV